jgi:hypothetical protein
MTHPHDDGPPPPPIEDYPVVLRGVAAASFAFGFFSLVVFWWWPFAVSLSTAGIVLGVAAYLCGARTERRGLLYAAGGAALSAFNLSVILFCYQGVHTLFLDH